MKNKVSFIIIFTLYLFCLCLFVGCVSKSDYNELQVKLDSVQNQYDGVNKELNEIKKVYPLRDFTSLTELQDWISTNRQPHTEYLGAAFRSALKVQEAGMEDGYMISVIYDEDDTDPDYGWIYNGALVNGAFYLWDPEKGIIFDDFTWLKK